MEKGKERIEQYNYDYGDRLAMENYENRRLILNYEIDSSALDEVVYFILRFNRDDIGIPVNERKPIIIYVNSPGGIIADGYALVDAIVTSVTPIYTVNLGSAMSMGFIIFLAGHKRYAMPHSEFLMHDGSSMIFDSVAKAKDRMEFETNELEQMTKKFILSRTAMTSAFYDEKYRVEFYFLPDKAKELGVVDYIVGQDCTFEEIL